MVETPGSGDRTQLADLWNVVDAAEFHLSHAARSTRRVILALDRGNRSALGPDLGVAHAGRAVHRRAISAPSVTRSRSRVGLPRASRNRHAGARLHVATAHVTADPHSVTRVHIDLRGRFRCLL